MFGLGRKRKAQQIAYPRLLNVFSGTQYEGYADLLISVDFGKGPETLPYTYNPTDDAPVAQQIKAWFAERPNVRLDGPTQKA